MIVTIDMGNTRVKWGIFDSEDLMREQGVFGYDELDSFAAATGHWRLCRCAVISCVAHQASLKWLTDVLTDLGMPYHVVRATENAVGVTNFYEVPVQLGSDRWAALVAARNRMHRAVVVVSAGTALTVDALGAHGEYLGGTIQPGYTMMRNVLAARTSALPQGRGGMQDFPRNTADGLFTGCVSAMVSAVERMSGLLHQHASTVPACVVTGGDGEILIQALNLSGRVQSVYEPNLVLYGLLLIKREEALKHEGGLE